MTSIHSLYPEELKEYLLASGEKPFRAGQIFSWLHEKRAGSFDDMTDISLALREKLKRDFSFTRLFIERLQESSLDGTRKYLFRLSDGNMIESVFMKYHHGNSVCVSTQVGCAMGCRFCASTVDGLVRSLDSAEILAQVYEIERDTKERVSNVVLMGSGEPMENYENVIRFIRLITHEKGNHMSARNITVSTCGIPDKIRAFAKEGLPVTLALSLHASDDATRRKLMPIANKYALSEVLSACDYYFSETGRRVSYEYSVVRGVNDSVFEAEKLSALLTGKNAHVNLIPVNPIRERSFERPDKNALLAFQNALVKNGINATIRREMGSDIDGACGQLRRRVLSENEEGGT